MHVRCILLGLGMISLSAGAFAQDSVVADEASDHTLALEIPAAFGVVYHGTIDTTETPDLTKWATEKLAPVVVAWYPKIVEMLPSDGFAAPQSFTITFTSDSRCRGDRRHARPLRSRMVPQQPRRRSDQCHSPRTSPCRAAVPLGPTQPRRPATARLAHRGHSRLHPLVPLRAAIPVAPRSPPPAWPPPTTTAATASAPTS